MEDRGFEPEQALEKFCNFPVQHYITDPITSILSLRGNYGLSQLSTIPKQTE